MNFVEIPVTVLVCSSSLLLWTSSHSHYFCFLLTNDSNYMRPKMEWSIARAPQLHGPPILDFSPPPPSAQELHVKRANILWNTLRLATLKLNTIKPCHRHLNVYLQRIHRNSLSRAHNSNLGTCFLMMENCWSNQQLPKRVITIP